MVHKWVVPYVVFPLYDRISGQYSWRMTRELLRLQWLSGAELKARALDKLKGIVEHAYLEVPYYASLFDNCGIQPGDVKSLDDLAGIPPTTPETVRRNWQGSMLAEGIPSKRRQKGMTSGSSGLPLNFYKDRGAKGPTRASLLYFRSLAGVQPWDAVVWLTNPVRMQSFRLQDRPLQRLARRYLLGEQMLHASGMIFDPTRMQDFVKQLPAARDYFVFAFPSYLARLIREISTKQIELAKKPKAVISYAQSLTPELARSTARTFQCPVYNMYSSHEVLFMAFSCPDHPDLMHVNTERAWLRVVDDRGRDCAAGETGRVLVTDLHNKVMPLINYDLGDFAVAGPPCPCGRGFPTLLRLEGRANESLHTIDGKVIAPTTIGRILFYADKYMPHIWEYQIYQPDLHHVTLRVVPTSLFDNKIKRMIQADLQAGLGDTVEVDIAVMEQLPYLDSGKRSLIISEVAL